MNDQSLFERLAGHDGPAFVDDAFEDRLYSVLQQEMRWGRSLRPTLLLAAAAAVLLALIGLKLAFLGWNVGEGVPSPSPTVTATPEARATPRATPPGGATAAHGTFVVDMTGASPRFQAYRATVTLPDGYQWRGWGPMVYTPGLGGFSVWSVSGIYPDPCRWQDALLKPLPTDPVSGDVDVDQVAAQLAAQPGRNPSALSHAEVGGRMAARIDLSLPAGLSVPSCTGGQYRSWDDPTGLGGPGFQPCPCEPHIGQVEALYILDIDGAVVLVDVWSYPRMTSDGGRAALASILDSLVVGSVSN